MRSFKLFTLCIVLFALVGLSCEKDEDEVNAPVVAESEFFFIEYADPIRLRSYNRISYDTLGEVVNVTPQSINKQYFIDLDEDGKNDISINYGHYQHGGNWFFSCSIQSLDGVEIYRSDFENRAIAMDEGETIEDDGNHFSLWGGSAQLKYNYNQPTAFKYSVFRKGRQFGYIKWLYVDNHLRLKALAFDMADNNKVTTGQES